MLKTFSFFFITLLFISCGKSGGGGNSTSKGDQVSLEELSLNSPVPSAAQNFDVDIKMINFNASQEDKVLIAADLLKKVVASAEFKNAVLNHQFNGKKAFQDNGGKSNAQVYKTIIEGSEKLHPGTDNRMNLELEVYNANTSVVGYTMPNVIRIWMNAKFFNKYTPANVTTNMMHEWLHKLGFGHAFQKTPTRQYSVPYAVGYMVAKIAKKL